VNVRESLRFALRGINANKLRSTLTTVGVLIGVAAVIVLLGVGTGSQVAIRNSIQTLGSNVLTVNQSTNNGRAGAGGGGFGGGGFGGGRAGGAGSAGSSGTSANSNALTVDDAYALNDASTLPHVKLVAPVLDATSVTAAYTGVSVTVTSFVGTSPSYFAVEDDELAYGQFFTDSDYLARRSVAVVGTTIAQQLVGGTGSAAVGKTVQFNGNDFTIDGVLKSKGSSGTTDQDNLVVAPLLTVQDKLTGVQASLNSILIMATSSTDLTAAEDEIYSVLDARHKVTSSDRNFTIVNQTQVADTVASANSTFTVLLAAVAGISLLVGGIGVMNIMLVTVTERTREIGIRKAIGARRSDIVLQFLTEAVLLSGFGGVAGVVVGLIGARFTIVGVHPVVPLWSIGASLGVAVVIGLFFGIYPANRAASLRPIDALRYE
jgi:putative ABC transport system permease protein